MRILRLAGLLLLAACAAEPVKTHEVCAQDVIDNAQVISVTTPGLAGASCTLKNDKGSWTVATTPASISIHRSAEPLVATCSKAGYLEVTTTTEATSQYNTVLNLIKQGIFGSSSHLMSDADYGYPSPIAVSMFEVTAPSAGK